MSYSTHAHFKCIGQIPPIKKASIQVTVHCSVKAIFELFDMLVKILRKDVLRVDLKRYFVLPQDPATCSVPTE